MFKAKYSINLVITRNLLSANSTYMASKPKVPDHVLNTTENLFPTTLGNPCNIFDMNSRVITVEGNFGLNKSKIAQKIAKYFGMKYFDDIEERKLYVLKLGKTYHDLLEYNAVLPPKSKIYTREMFWNDKDPIKNGKPLLLQVHHYYWRYFEFCKAMSYLIRSGQGIVVKRSPWTDNVMALTFVECGLMSEPAYKLFNLIRCESIPNLWKPNFIVYLKASPQTIRRHLNERNHWMKNAPNFSDKFIETYNEIMETKYLNNAATHSRVITIDLDENNIDDEEEFEFLMESMAKENRNFNEIEEFDPLFYDWTNAVHNKRVMAYWRRYFGSAVQCFVNSFPTIILPKALSEGAYSEDDLAKLHAIVFRDKRFDIDPEFDPKTNSWFEILFPKLRFNYASIANTPYIFMRRAYE